MTESGLVGMSERIKRLVAERDGGKASVAARRCGISQPTMHRLVNGEQTDPPVSTINKIAQTYGVPVGWLMYGPEYLKIESRNKPVAPFTLPGSPADDTLRWLDAPESRRLWTDHERILKAYGIMLDRGWDLPTRAVVDAWRDYTLSRSGSLNAD